MELVRRRFSKTRYMDITRLLVDHGSHWDRGMVYHITLYLDEQRLRASLPVHRQGHGAVARTPYQVHHRSNISRLDIISLYGLGLFVLARLSLGCIFARLRLGDPNGVHLQNAVARLHPRECAGTALYDTRHTDGVVNHGQCHPDALETAPYQLHLLVVILG